MLCHRMILIPHRPQTLYIKQKYETILNVAKPYIHQEGIKDQVVIRACVERRYFNAESKCSHVRASDADCSANQRLDLSRMM